MQMWSVCICMQSTDVIPIIQDWMSYPSFSCEAEDMKSTLARVYGWHNFHSGVHWQYVVCYAYSTYVNVCLRKKGGYNSRTLHSQASTHDPLLVLLLRSIAASLTLHTPPALLCKQMFLRRCQFWAFSHIWSRYCFAGRLQSDRKQQKLPPSSAQRERGRVVWARTAAWGETGYSTVNPHRRAEEAVY